jgi:hypothetical protein
MTYNVVIEFADGYTQTTNFMLLKFASKFMDYVRAHPLHNMVSISLVCIADEWDNRA